MQRARDYIPHTMKVEIETETLDQVREALASGADIIMLDNMDLETMRQAVAMIGGRVLVEASGGALYSAYLFWRKQVLLNRVLGNVLIAAGALAPAMAGSFVKAGLADVLYVSELIGAILMFAGFYLSTTRATIPVATPVQSTQ